MKKILTSDQRIKYEILVRKTKNLDEKDRLRAILAYDKGHAVPDIASILNISDSTTYNYINDFLDNRKIAHDPKSGSECKMIPAQEVELISHLYQVTL